MLELEPYSSLADWDYTTPAPEPNLITGVGHGRFRPLRRRKAEANHAKKQKKARKATKRSRRINRKER